MDGISDVVLLKALDLQYIQTMIPFFVGVIVILLLFVFLTSILERTKTQKYRQIISDMYVAATIRKFASEDGLNLDDEYKKFKRFETKKKLEYTDVDGAIESNLKDKVTEKTMNEIDAMNEAAKKKA